MRKLAILLVCCCATQAWADVPLFYEGFDYDAGLNLASATSPQGVQHQPSGNFWSMAGTSAVVPVVIEGNEYDAATGLPAPTGDSVAIVSGGNGSTNRIEIPDMPTGDRTVYWSGFLRVVDINGLAGAPGLSLSEAGIVLAGYNNTAGSQAGNPSVLAGFLAIKRASANPDSPLFNSYYAGTASNSQANDCGVVGNYRCANRHFADYVEGATEDVPTVYAESSPLAATRPRFTAVPIEQGELAFFVASYEIVTGADNDTARLWINPDPNTFGMETPPTANVIAPTDLENNATYAANDITNVVSYFLRANAGAPTDTRFDELRIGLSWASVTDPMAPPEGVLGDYNGDGSVNAADYTVWRDGGTLLNEVETIGEVTQEDYDAWFARFGNTAGSGASTVIPEPSSLLLLALAVSLGIGGSASRFRQG
ncbi:MAG: PEP-CTERM sorting domain-containing protein [Pirellulales bacterium]